MKTILKAYWHGHNVTVKAAEHFEPNGFNNTVCLYIKVAETHRLPKRFIRGTRHKANLDIIETTGGMPKYIGRLLDAAAMQEHKRRTSPIVEQLSFGL